MEKHIEARVTAICEMGCVRVREVMAALERGEIPPEVAPSSPTECGEILRELRAIMAVYDARD